MTDSFFIPNSWTHMKTSISYCIHMNKVWPVTEENLNQFDLSSSGVNFIFPTIDVNITNTKVSSRKINASN